MGGDRAREVGTGAFERVDRIMGQILQRAVLQGQEPLGVTGL